MRKKYQHLLVATVSLVATAVMSAECTSPQDCFAKADNAIRLEKYEEALDFGRQGCDEYEYADSCAIVGGLYQLGRGVELNPSQALYYLEEACELGSGDGCAVLASAYYSGQVVTQDVDKAYQMASSGCELDNAISCMLLGSMQIVGQGTEQNITSGQANLDKACEMEREVCSAVAQVRDAYKKQGFIE